MDDLYREQILEHYKRPHNFGRLDRYDLEFEDSNPFCGDEQHVFIRLDDAGRVAEIAFEGKGCAISTAATSMLTGSSRGHEPRGTASSCPRSSSSTCWGIRHLGDPDQMRPVCLKVVKGAGRASARQLGGRGRSRRPGRGRGGLSLVPASEVPPSRSLKSDFGSRINVMTSTSTDDEAVLAESITVCRADECDAGAMRLVEAGGRRSASSVAAVAGAHAIEDRCSHDDGPLAEGEFDGERVYSGVSPARLAVRPAKRPAGDAPRFPAGRHVRRCPSRRRRCEVGDVEPFDERPEDRDRSPAPPPRRS